MAGISTKASGSLTNKFKYNGKELQSGEFSDGSGLEMYDFGARMYDNYRRFWTLDRYAEKYYPLSPYSYTANNPVSFIDHNGDYITINGLNGDQVLYENGKLYSYTTDKNGAIVKGDVYKGKDAFIAGAASDLNSIRSFKLGKTLVGDLQNSKEGISINHRDESDEQQEYDEKTNKVNYHQASSGFHDNVMMNTSFIKLGHELGHAWDDIVGQGEAAMYKDNGGLPQTEVNAVKFEDYLRAMDGKEIRKTYGGIPVNGVDGSIESAKNFSFPLRKNESMLRIEPAFNPSLPARDATQLRKDIYIRVQKFSSAN